MPHAQRRISAGFTLIEIMTAVAIVGVLAAIALLQYQGYTTRARVAGALEFAGGSRTRVGLDLAQGKNVKTDLLNGNPLEEITALVWHPGRPGEPVTGYILATMNLPGQGVRHAFALELKQGTLWQCVNAARHVDPASALDDAYLPAACRVGADALPALSDSPSDAKPGSQEGCNEGDPATLSKSGDRVPRPTAFCPQQAAANGNAGTGTGAGAGSRNGSNSSGSNGNSSAGSGNSGSGENNAAGVIAANGAGNPSADAAGAASKSGRGTVIATCGDHFVEVKNECRLAGSPSPRVCRSSRENCETAHVPGRNCTAALPFAANVVENQADGTRYLTRRCLSLKEAFQAVVKNRDTPACARYDADTPAYAHFTCVFPCYGFNCNSTIVPEDPGTRLTWDNMVAESAGGKLRAKRDTDLPDLFDTWRCPRGTQSDAGRPGRCVPEKGFAGTLAPDGKSAAGVAAKK